MSPQAAQVRLDLYDEQMVLAFSLPFTAFSLPFIDLALPCCPCQAAALGPFTKANVPIVNIEGTGQWRCSSSLSSPLPSSLLSPLSSLLSPHRQH